MKADPRDGFLLVTVLTKFFTANYSAWPSSLSLTTCLDLHLKNLHVSASSTGVSQYHPSSDGLMEMFAQTIKVTMRE